jgi:hypothetical protein
MAVQSRYDRTIGTIETAATIPVAGCDPRGDRVRHRHLPASGESGPEPGRADPPIPNCPRYGGHAAKGETAMSGNFPNLLLRLADAGVHFVVVGGYAGIVHGCTYMTVDVDICCDFSVGNLLALQKALSDLHPIHRMTPGRKPLELTDYGQRGHESPSRPGGRPPAQGRAAVAEGRAFGWTMTPSLSSHCTGI